MPKKFYFALNALSKVRKHMKQKAEIDYSFALSTFNSQNDLLLNEKAGLSKLMEYKNQITYTTTPKDLMIADSMIMMLGGRVKLMERAVDNLREEMNDKRFELIEASREHKVMGKLKEKSMVNYKKYLRKIEVNSFDEISSDMSRKKQGEKD